MSEHDLHLDHDRSARLGFPEVVFGGGKTPAECVAAASGLAQRHPQVLVTRCSEAALAALAAALPEGHCHTRSGCFTLGEPEPTLGPVAVVSAGTSDAHVAEEAVVTLRMRGVSAERFADCGVAGLHRLQGHIDGIRACKVVIAVAGMDAALPTVLKGLIARPVIGVPTSVGYGVADGGRSALHSMLVSCAPASRWSTSTMGSVRPTPPRTSSPLSPAPTDQRQRALNKRYSTMFLNSATRARAL